MRGPSPRARRRCLRTPVADAHAHQSPGAARQCGLMPSDRGLASFENQPYSNNTRRFQRRHHDASLPTIPRGSHPGGPAPAGPLAEAAPSPAPSTPHAPGQVFAVWTGQNAMSDVRRRSLDILRYTNLGLDVHFVTPRNLSEYLVTGHPLHPSYEDLSFHHRADYLRAYFMHHHGGAYADIKPLTGAWGPVLDKLNSSPTLWAGGMSAKALPSFTPHGSVSPALAVGRVRSTPPPSPSQARDSVDRRMAVSGGTSHRRRGSTAAGQRARPAVGTQPGVSARVGRTVLGLAGARCTEVPPPQLHRTVAAGVRRTGRGRLRLTSRRSLASAPRRNLSTAPTHLRDRTAARLTRSSRRRRLRSSRRHRRRQRP